MLVKLVFFVLFANDFTAVHSAEYSAPLQFTEEPSDIKFSSKTSAYLRCVAKASSSYASDEQIVITWRFRNGSKVRDIPNLVQTLPNGTLWFKPFQSLVPAIHHATYQCVANLTNLYIFKAILSRHAIVTGVIVKPFKVIVEDQYVARAGTATLSCIYPRKISSYVKIRWFADKKEEKAEPSGNLVIRDVKDGDAVKLYYCIVVNTLSEKSTASNVAKLFILKPGTPNVPFKFSISPEDTRVYHGQTVLLECLASRVRNVEYSWEHNNKKMSSHLVDGRSLRIMDVTLDKEGNYTCIARDKTSNEEISASSRLRVQVPLAFRERPTKICTPVLLNVTFPCEVTGYPKPKITWYKNAREIKNNVKRRKRVGNSLVFQPAFGKDEGIYQCIASNEFETIHQAASLIVGAQAPRITKSFTSKNLSLYDKLDISCTVTSATEKPELFWYKDDVLIDETADDRIVKKDHMNLWTLQISNVTAADSGIYRCEAMNRAGSNSSEATILVEGPAKLTYLPKNVRGLLGKDVSIECKAHGFPPIEITWLDLKGYTAPNVYRHVVRTTDDGVSNLTIKRLQTSDEGRYTCKAGNKHGPEDSASVKLTVYSPPKETRKQLKFLNEGVTEQLVCNGQCIKFTKNGREIQNSSRIFFKNYPPLGFCFLKINSILRSDSGKFTCHKGTTSAAVHTETQEIIVLTKPRFVDPNPPNSVDVLEHDNVTMTCLGSGFPTPRTVWRRKTGGSFVEVQDSSRFQVTSNGSLTILNTGVNDETDYSCEIKNSQNPGTDMTITLNVNVPAKIINWIANAFGNVGNITKLSCGAMGDETLNFTWFKNGKTVTRSKNVMIEQFPKLKTASLTFLSTTRKDDGVYTCKVFNSFGKDNQSMQLNIRDKPDPPILNAKISKKTKNSITIVWKDAFDGNLPIKSYKIYYRAPISGLARNFEIPKQSSWTISKLEPYTSYEIYVRAENALGLSENSNVIRVDTAEDAPSVAPTLIVIPRELSANAPNKQSLKIKWKRLSVQDSNGLITKHVIWYKQNSSATSVFTKRTVQSIDGTQTILSNLNPYTYYKIKIQAFTKVGAGPNSTSIIRRTLEGVPRQPPNNIEINNKTSSSISLSWRAPSRESLNGKLIGYRVYYESNTKPVKRSVDTSGEQTNLEGLGKYTNYNIRIAARTARGPGQKSAPISVFTNEDIPGPPKDLSAITTSVRSVKLKWSKPDEPNGRVTYTIFYVLNSAHIHHPAYENKQQVEKEEVTSYEFNDLTENRTYFFWVCAKTSKGVGNCTDHVMASTSKGPPSFIDSRHNGEVTARWNATVHLTGCRFAGFPIPILTWLDFQKRPIDLTDDKYSLTLQEDLVIHDLQREDSKRYECRVRNKWGTILKTITLKVQTPPDPPKSIVFQGINSTAVKISWINGFDGNSILTGFVLRYRQRYDTLWTKVHVPGDNTGYFVNHVESGRKYLFQMSASNEIGDGAFSETKFMKFDKDGMVLKPIEVPEIEDEVKTRFSHKTIFKDSAVLGTLIGVCLFIIIVVFVLALLTKLGYNPGSKLAQRSVEAWRWLVAKGLSANHHRRNMNGRSGGSSTDGHLGGSSSSLSQPASNNGSTFSLPRSSSRVTESGYAGSVFPIPLPFGNHTPGPNGGVRASGSSDEGIGPETRNEVCTRPGTGDKEYCQPSVPPRSSNGTPAPPTLVLSSREYIDPEGIINETCSSKRQSKEMEEKTANEREEVPRAKERIYVQSLGNCTEFFPVSVNMSSGRPKYEDGHFIIGPDVDRILAYRPPRCYDSTSSEYSSSRDELAQAYEFGKLHHLDDFYGRPTLESASSSGETANSEKDGICRFTSELSEGRPFLIPVAILPPPPNQRMRTNRKRNPQGVPLNTYYEKDETLV